MIQLATTILKWAIRLGFIFTAILAFLAIITVLISLGSIVVNQTVIGDLVAIIQLWCPFNFSMVFNWLTTTASLILFFYMASWAYNTISEFVKD